MIIPSKQLLHRMSLNTRNEKAYQSITVKMTFTK